MSMYLFDLQTYRNGSTDLSTSYSSQLRLVKSAKDCVIVPLHTSPKLPHQQDFASIPSIPQTELDAVVNRIKAGYYNQTTILTDIAEHLGETFRATAPLT